MTPLNKAYWSSDKDNNMSISMSIAKVDKERRIVSGFATLDNVDKQHDIVPTDVSLKAFDRFRGNLREMHQPIAVGRVVGFRQEKFFDKNSDKFFNGVFVDAYISKGAQDTWEKVLDGTLSGFSIGGIIKDAEDTFDSEMDKAVRLVKEYDLTELSLVDNPANQFANIVSIQKITNDTQIDGIITKADLENVYWCESDDIVRLSSTDDTSCPSCETSMKSIGFVETKDTEKAMTIKGLLKKFIGGESLEKSENSVEETENTAIDNEESIAENNIKEENNVSEENVENTVEDTVEEVVAEAPATEEAPAEETVEKSVDAVDAVEETVEKSADPEEAPAEEASDEVEVEKSVATESTDSELVKAVDEIKVSVTEAVSELVSTIKSLNEEIADLKKGVTTVTEEVAAVKGNLDEFGKRVDGLEDDTAVRKSGDLGGVVQGKQIRKGSMWGGRFLNSADLYQ
jgi:hypothetical protein